MVILFTSCLCWWSWCGYHIVKATKWLQLVTRQLKGFWGFYATIHGYTEKTTYMLNLNLVKLIFWFFYISDKWLHQANFAKKTMILIFYYLREIVLTFHLNCLLGRQCPWKVKTFLWKTHACNKKKLHIICYKFCLALLRVWLFKLIYDFFILYKADKLNKKCKQNKQKCPRLFSDL